MHSDDASCSLLLHGRPEPPTEPLPLRAGDLTMLYEDGALRLIRRGEHEVIRSIYAAVRDHHWSTVPGRIHDEKIEQNDDSFTITYERAYDWNGVKYASQCKITGDAQGVAFSFHGTARSEFRRNRIGICVLHPVRECAGQACHITTPEGTTYDAAFSVNIQPDQPFLNIKAMRWHFDQDSEAVLEFEGDVFETEDQRNFADASYKTYSTPQERPKPVAVHPDDEVIQKVTLRVDATHPAAMLGTDAVMLSRSGGPIHPLPVLGLSVSPADSPLSDTDAQAVRSLRLSHLRVALDLTQANWADALSAARAESRLLGNLPLDLALTFGSEPIAAWDALKDALNREPVAVRSVLLLSRGQSVTTPEIEALAPAVRAALPGALIGGGTDNSFVELNRNRLAAHGLDFLGFAAHPQIHLEDNRTVTENAAALADTVRSAHALTERHAIHITPLVLKPGIDPRQKSLLGAVWALSSIKHLAEAGAASVTLGPIAGHGGILHENAVFPIYFVLREIWGDGPADVLPFASSDASRLEGLLLKRDVSVRCLLANPTPLTQSARVMWDTPEAHVTLLDEAALRRGILSDPDSLRADVTVTPAADGFLALTLPPFAVAVLET